MDWKRVLISAGLATSAAVADVFMQMASDSGEFNGWEPVVIALVPFALDRIQRWIRERGASDVATLLAFACVGLTSSDAMADRPRIVVNGPSTAVPGEIIEFDCSRTENDATHFSYRISPEIPGKLQLKPIDRDGLPGNECVQVASYAGKYLITIVASNCDGHDILYLDFVVPGSPLPPSPGPTPIPPTPPGPEPDPQPEPEPSPPTPTPPTPTPPDLPDGDFGGLPRKVRDLANLVTGANRKTEAGKLADCCESVSAAIAAGGLSTPLAILSELNSLKNSAFNADERSRWAAFVAGMNGLLSAAGLSSLDDIARALREVAMGLRAVK